MVMTLKQGLEKAISISFSVSSSVKEPNIVSIQYLVSDIEIIKQANKAMCSVINENPITFFFKIVTENILLAYLYDKNQDTPFAMMQLQYQTDNFEEFVAKVKPEEPLAFIFEVVDSSANLYLVDINNTLLASGYEFER